MIRYQLRLKMSGRAPVDVLIESETLPRVGDEFELYEYGGVEAVRGYGYLGDDPSATFWVEAVHRPLSVRDGYNRQMVERETMVVAADRPFRIGEKDPVR